MAKATVTSKGQVTIPKKIRDRLGLQQGDKLDFHIERDGTLSARHLDENGDKPPLAGMLNDKIDPDIHVTVEDMDRGIREYVAKRVMRSLRDDRAADEDDRA